MNKLLVDSILYIPTKPVMKHENWWDYPDELLAMSQYQGEYLYYYTISHRFEIAFDTSKAILL